MPISRRDALDASHLDGVLTLDVERGVAAIDLAEVSFVDAYALAGLACFIASAARGGLPVELVVPEDPTFGAGSPGCISAMSWIHSGSASRGRSGSRRARPEGRSDRAGAVLVDRGGSCLILKGAPERTVELARRAAQNRGVTDRLETA